MPRFVVSLEQLLAWFQQKGASVMRRADSPPLLADGCKRPRQATQANEGNATSNHTRTRQQYALEHLKQNKHRERPRPRSTRSWSSRCRRSRRPVQCVARDDTSRVLRQFQWKSTGKVTILWKLPLTSEIILENAPENPLEHATENPQ